MAEEWEVISPIPYVPCERDCENSSMWFWFVSFFSPKNYHSKESPEENVQAQGHLSKPDSQHTQLTLNPSVINTARFVYFYFYFY